MRKALLLVLAVVLSASFMLTGCHKLGLVKSAPRKPAASQNASAAQ
jgi:uncharacterized lipoprotein YajG